MHDVVDLRSDTLTLPTAAMREAMARAEVGDDVWEEDPTVKRLEEVAARRTGKEAALFVSSGTQGNLVSVLAQTEVVIFGVDRADGAAELCAGSLARKVKIHQVGPGQIRCVTHKDVDGEDIERALEAFREITSGW